MKKKQHRHIDPQRARAAITGNWYADISSPASSWPTCTRCGQRTAIADQAGRCLRCKLAAKAEARKQEAAG